MKVKVIWDVMLCCLVNSYQCFGGVFLPFSGSGSARGVTHFSWTVGRRIWKHHAPQKCCNGLQHHITSLKTWIFINIAVRISDLTNAFFFLLAGLLSSKYCILVLLWCRTFLPPDRGIIKFGILNLENGLYCNISYFLAIVSCSPGFLWHCKIYHSILILFMTL